MSTLGERLREIRKDAKKTQEELGAIGGVRKQAQMKYERDERLPDAAYFVRLDNADLDIHFVITGHPGPKARERLAPHALRAAVRHVAEMQESYDAVLGGYRKVTADEEDLIGHYRRADKHGKAAILKTAAALASSGSTHSVQQNFHGNVRDVAGRDIINRGSKK